LSLKVNGKALLVSAKSMLHALDNAELRVAASEIVTATEKRNLEAAAPTIAVENVIGIGGGSAMDVAKLRGAQLAVPVTLIPSVLSTDAMFTSSAAIREDGRVCYLPTGAAARVVIDEELLLCAPPSLNALGSCDVLSILTASDDWRRDRAVNASDAVVRDALGVCDALLGAEADIAAGNRRGLRAVLGALQAEVRLCADAGSDRLEEGSEHHFAYALEAHAPRSMHGALVGLSILLSGRLQGQDIERIAGFFNATGIAGHCLRIPRTAVVETLVSMSTFVRDNCYPASVWSRVALNEAQAFRLCDDVLGRLRP
jgi:glycerol dehydrogenase-like iron-containing ADH family enzyme